ncbi:hypothetical protein N7491_004085 [Penicillium cf. griseofulvum]|uniref:Uncharacterized protein n=1 Tax=Penicillium cf. griseofulvum TaxID=2972120 RepID=A0A9W9T0W8_9EURO|nr:hypothetical protein N7472_001740 [Penicillium cf. griseofulvum]KAJ5437535.1 hypothetical protein N7445_006079 [Penicillium cf. griseofulvum]KAJ5441679.1 hypothetical protein N7491_004085 [Penicillium cf. griseofulvum]
MSALLIDSEGFRKLKELSAWVFTFIQMEVEMHNLFRCVDETRREKVQPFLSHVGLNNQNFGYKICRVTGNLALEKSSHFRTLMFPLSIGPGSRSIGSGEVMTNLGLLKPGYWIEIRTVLLINALMDCLIVLLPEQTESQSVQIEPTIGGSD